MNGRSCVLGAASFAAGALMVATLNLATISAVQTDAPVPVCSSDIDCAARGFQDAYGVTPDKIRRYADRYPLASDDTVDPVAECLVSQGFRGLPDDGDSVIYAGSDAIESCAQRV